MEKDNPRTQDVSGHLQKPLPKQSSLGGAMKTGKAKLTNRQAVPALPTRELGIRSLGTALPV